MAHPCIDSLLSVIDTLRLKEGDRLPSERSLAEQLSVSRNTVRETLISLAAAGHIEIRGRSGCYLRTASTITWESLRKNGSPTAALEALGFMAPQLAACAAERCTPETAQALQDLTARLGRALVHRDGTLAAQIFLYFINILVELTSNPYIALLLRELDGNDRLRTTLGQLDQPRIDVFFPIHVGLLQAIKEHDRERARALAINYLDAFSDLLGFASKASPGARSKSQ
ncbi:GntR family transcriptional regulator [Breoghania sp.]|uniref:FadR/GntR family transcriptional regulator n=1 Tax=Breoghania sp. TaxID=2065378 RepID=UPI0029C9C307|nr:GntR family transcriptional regulator [Breoghania sp.]